VALAIDASTPAYAAGSNDPYVTASFTPPNDSLLVVVVTGDWFGGTPTITPTSTSLTFTSQGKFGALSNGVIEIFTAPVGSNGGSARTVSVTTSLTSDVGGAKVYVVTDFYATSPVEACAGGGPDGTNSWTPTVLTTTTDGCWVFGGAVNWVGGTLASTSTDVFEEFNDSDLSVMVARKSAATSPAGAVTLNFDQVAAGTPVWSYGAIAIRPSTYIPPPVEFISQGAAVAGTTSITTAAYGDGWAAGDLIVYTVASNHATTEATEPTVDGFTNIGTLNGGGGTQGAGTGNRRLTFFTKEAAGGDDTTPTISLTTGNVMIAASTVLRKGSSATWETAIAAFGAETTAGTGWTQAMTTDPGLAVDDLLLLACAVRDTSNSSAEGVTSTGATFGTVSERTDQSSETGNDIALHVSTVHVSGGPNSAAPTRTATHSTSETGVMGVLRIRASSGVEGAATGTFGFTATAQGTVSGPVPGQAAATFGFTATSNGVPRTSGAAVATFGFTAVASGTGPQRFITAAAGTGTASYFADQSSNPILIQGYVLWGLLTNAGRWGGTWQSDLEDAVDGLAAMGCNVIYTESLGNSQNGAADDSGETWDGVAPFTGGDPATFNNTFWQRTDYLFDLCEAAGITVFYNWAYSTDLDDGALSTFTTGDFTDYGTSLAARYKTRPNLVWMMGGDYFDTFNTQVTAVKAAIRAEGDTHLFGVQNYPETTSRRDLENDAVEDTGTDNSEFNFVYSYNAIYWGIEYAYTEASPLPVMWGDGHFDQDTTADRKVMRDLTWWTFSSGGRGMIFGSEGTWAWLSGALANLTSETFPNTDMGGIWDLFTGFTNWHQLVPDTDSSFVTAGRGTKSDYVTSSGGGGGEYNSSDTQAPYVTASITADGTLAVVYFPVDQTITVDDTELAAGYTATWVDPINGATSSATIAGTYSPTGNNSLGGPDWLLVFEASAVPVTGVAAGSFGFTGTANGVDRSVGTAAAAFGFTATATGVDRAVGAALATFGLTATAAGVDRAVGVALAAFGFTASAAGEVGTPPVAGQASASFGFTAAAGGVPRTSGAALATLGFMATASGSVGTPPVAGTATAAFGFTAAGSGAPRTGGAAVASFGFTAAASGIDRAVGVAAAAFGFVGAASGIDRAVGAASGAFGFAASASGVPEVFAVAVAVFGFTATAQGFAGTPPVTGAAVGVFGFTAGTQGQPRTPGAASASFGFTGSALGRPRVVAGVVGAFGFVAVATGVRVQPGSAQATFGFVAVASGQGATVSADSVAAVLAAVTSTPGATVAATSTASVTGN
jgi:hypothetical protein